MRISANSARDLDAKLVALGANRICNRVECDVDVDEPFEQWKTELIPRLHEIAAGSTNSEACCIVPPSVIAEVKPAAVRSCYPRESGFGAAGRQERPDPSTKSSKTTLHLAFSIKDTGIMYEAGDACGVLPQNDLNLVAEILQTLKFNGNEQVLVRQGGDHNAPRRVDASSADHAPEPQDRAAITLLLASARRCSCCLLPSSRTQLRQVRLRPRTHRSSAWSFPAWCRTPRNLWPCCPS